MANSTGVRAAQLLALYTTYALLPILRQTLPSCATASAQQPAVDEPLMGRASWAVNGCMCLPVLYMGNAGCLMHHTTPHKAFMSA